MKDKTLQQRRVLTLVAPTGVEILNRQQVAERLGIPPKSIYALVRSRANDPCPVHYAGRELKFVWGEVFDWFLNRKRKPRTLKNPVTGKSKTKKAAA
jgi:predicted DNA-binding transcriptional regulator AlpA